MIMIINIANSKIFEGENFCDLLAKENAQTFVLNSGINA